MPTLYVTEPGATVRMRGESFIVTVDRVQEAGERETRQRETLIEVEPHRLELVALVGRSHVTSDAAHACLERGVVVAYLDRRGRLLGRLLPSAPRSGDLRVLQYARHADAEARLALARSVVAAKTRGAVGMLAGVQSNAPGNEALPAAMAELRTLPARLASCDSIDSLRGLEGLAARTYFEALRSAFRAEIPFGGRKSRPPPDPANPLLSFGYVLVTNVLAGMVEARGLDPAVGFYHEVRPGRPSLALDLLEEFRHPLVDRFVLRACNLRVFKPGDFEPDEAGGVRMQRPALQRFFEEWERFLLRPVREAATGERTLPRKLFERQIERLVADLRGKGPYRPFPTEPGECVPARPSGTSSATTSPTTNGGPD